MGLLDGIRDFFGGESCPHCDGRCKSRRVFFIPLGTDLELVNRLQELDRAAVSLGDEPALDSFMARLEAASKADKDGLWANLSVCRECRRGRIGFEQVRDGDVMESRMFGTTAAIYEKLLERLK